MSREYPVCERCGSEDVKVDAWATWDGDGWELDSTYDAAHCDACEGETTLEWRTREEDRA